MDSTMQAIFDDMTARVKAAVTAAVTAAVNAALHDTNANIVELIAWKPHREATATDLQPASTTVTVDVIPELAAPPPIEPSTVFELVMGPPTTCSTDCSGSDIGAPSSTTHTTPSRLLPAAAPALTHELKVLRPMPWPSFKCHLGAAYPMKPGSASSSHSMKLQKIRLTQVELKPWPSWGMQSWFCMVMGKWIQCCPFFQLTSEEGGKSPVMIVVFTSKSGNTEVPNRKSATLIAEEEDPESNIDHAVSNFHQEYEVFELRIVHRKNRTGFEENKDCPIVLNLVIAGRYYVTEYLSSAAFSKAVQAHDLQTGTDICLEIIKNDKDFFDQSLDGIKLLKFVNKYDPSDEHHVLRLYDYFYHQEHLFIVTELLRANLYEFLKYKHDSGGEVYFTFPRIQAIARQCLEALEYLHQLRIVHCDLKPENTLIKSYSRCEIKVIDLGSSCFLTDSLCLYVQSRSYRAPEVILGLPYDQRIDIWSLGCILAELYTGEVLFPNEPVSMMLARMIGIIGPIDMEMLALGQETQKYFTDDYDLFTKNEETDHLEYLVPEKSSLRHHLRCPDPQFVDFLSYLLQINPRKRPTASEALEHPWLSSEY